MDFQESLNKCHIHSYHYDFFYTQDNNDNPFIFVIKNNKFEVYNLDEVNQKDFLLFIFKENYIFDCYFIHFKGEEKKNPIYLKREEEEKEIRKLVLKDDYIKEKKI